MKYKYIEAIDKYYKQVWEKPDKEVREVGYTKSTWYEDANSIYDVKRPICICCRTQRLLKEYPLKSKNGALMGMSVRKDKSSPIMEYRGTICVHCLVKLYENQVAKYKKTPYEALYIVCAISNHYYDDAFAHRVYEDDNRVYDTNMKNVSPDVHWVDLYFREVYNQNNNEDKCFWNSDNFQFNKIITSAKEQQQQERKQQRAVEEAEEIDIEKCFSEEDKSNYNLILSTFHYDPFEGEDLKDRKKSMTYLVTMIDDAMKDDLVRMRAALEIVHSYLHMDEINRHIKELEKDGPDGASVHASEIKKYVDMRKAEQAVISSFAKDNGLSEKYAMSKTKGSGTMSAIVRDMQKENYDFGAVNKFDIETSEAIRQVSDISAESIFKQINFQSADYADMVREQGKAIHDKDNEIARLQEELRLIREKILKQDILEELKDELTKKGLPTDNADEMVAKELNKNRVKLKLA